MSKSKFYVFAENLRI